MTVELAEKEKKLEKLIRLGGRAAVACSGGVDSTLLLKVAHDVLGHENTIAVFAETPLLPPGEAEAAKKIIDCIGSRLLTIGLNPLVWPEFTQNPRERCYLCKKKIYQTFLERLKELHFDILMDGTNLDDLSDFRPGLKALSELNVKTPLAEAGLTKNDVRRLSNNLNLPNWDKHSSSCLATRVAAGQQINEEKLGIIKKCEAFLHSLDFQGCRVRMANDHVIIELQEKDIERFSVHEIRLLILKKFNDFNLKRVFLDLHGRKERGS
ncbi:MAG: ATP-dependent sacrificial sulfur transferase LarE [Deltaproteobacteria bacterium]|jgi:uncharacterized protein|nr:ATP-dependent sacrificial sulfur transferase LarE [Deltaproteobacteria bacterium]